MIQIWNHTIVLFAFFYSYRGTLKFVISSFTYSAKNLCQRSFISFFPEIYLQRKEIVKNCPMLKSADIKTIARQVALEMYALNDEVLSLSDVATKLNKSEAAIKQMCYRGQLPFHKQHKTYYFSKNEITNFLLKKVNV